MKEAKIIQIIPVNGVYGVFKDENGEFLTPIVCAALLDNGEVRYLDSDSDGINIASFADETVERFYYPEMKKINEDWRHRIENGENEWGDPNEPW